MMTCKEGDGTGFDGTLGLDVLVCDVMPELWRDVLAMVDGAVVDIDVANVDVSVGLGMVVLAGGGSGGTGGAGGGGTGGTSEVGTCVVVEGGEDAVDGEVVVVFGGTAGTKPKARTMLFREMAANTSAHAAEFPISWQITIHQHSPTPINLLINPMRILT